MAIVRPNIYGATFTEDPLAGERREESRKRSENAQRHIGAVSQAWLRDLAIKDALKQQKLASQELLSQTQPTGMTYGPKGFSAASSGGPAAPAAPAFTETGIPTAYIDQMKARDDELITSNALQRAVNQLLLEDQEETVADEDRWGLWDAQSQVANIQRQSNIDYGDIKVAQDTERAEKMLRDEQLMVEKAERAEAKKLRRALLVQSGLEEPVAWPEVRWMDDVGDRMDQIEVLKRLLAEQGLFGERPRLP